MVLHTEGHGYTPCSEARDRSCLLEGSKQEKVAVVEVEVGILLYFDAVYLEQFGAIPFCCRDGARDRMLCRRVVEPPEPSLEL